MDCAMKIMAEGAPKDFRKKPGLISGPSKKCGEQ